MQRFISRLVVINAVICAIFGILFALPVNRPEIGLIIGLLFGSLNGLLIESIFRRWKGRWLYQRRLLVLVLLEVVLLLFLVFPAYIAYLSLRPSRMPVAALPTDLLDTAEDVLLQTEDGTSLSGWYLPSTNGAAILALHGFGGNRLEVLPHARLLNQQGYGVLLMDMRAHGASGGEIFADGWNAVADAHVMVDYLRARPQVNRIGALGLSSGAISIIHAGAAIDSIEAFVAEGTGVAAVEDLLDPLIPHPAIAWLLVPDYWMSFRFTSLYTGLAPMPPLREQVGHIAPRPILLIAGAESMWEPELAAKYAHSAGASADVWVIANAGHIAGISSAPEEYAERVLGFFGAALLTQ